VAPSDNLLDGEIKAVYHLIRVCVEGNMNEQPIGDAKTNADIGDCNLMILDYLEHRLKTHFEQIPKRQEWFFDSLGPAPLLF
jgi:hypothetical protein